MPVFCQHLVRRISQAEFRELDYRVTAHAFAVHNDLGRFCDEAVYHEALAARLRGDGISEMVSKPAILLTHGSFQKQLFPDLLVALSALFELKAASALTGAHQKQLLTYLLLLELFHGKLFNFRNESVEHYFVSTSLDRGEQRRFDAVNDPWRAISPRCAEWKERLLALLTDWGVFLDLSLYQEALVWFLGGADRVIGTVAMLQDGRPFATQRVHLIEPEIAFKLTAFTEAQAGVETHLRRFLDHSRLTAIQWVNFNHHTIEFKTLSR